MGLKMERRLRDDRSEQWRPQLTREEQRVGWVFFALYLFVLPFLVGVVTRFLDEHLEIGFTAAQTSAIYYAAVLLLLTATFWDFLKNAFRILSDNTRQNLFALAVGFVGGLLLTVVLSLLPLPVENPVIGDYKAQFLLSPGYTTAVVMFLRPLAEEVMYRGLLFGSLRKKNRILAYGASISLSALSAVWQLAIPGEPLYLLLALRYIPLAAATTWAYDIGGSVLTPMALRVILNGLFLVFALIA